MELSGPSKWRIEPGTSSSLTSWSTTKERMAELLAKLLQDRIHGASSETEMLRKLMRKSSSSSSNNNRRRRSSSNNNRIKVDVAVELDVDVEAEVDEEAEAMAQQEAMAQEDNSPSNRLLCTLGG